ncbi:MAG: SAM-dependent methyltransferase [Labilithrix sp.]|nr:SAM-dependent methyltransferase [Labilithrix sp.]
MLARPVPAARSVSSQPLAARIAFVRAHAALTPVPLVPEVVVATATEVTPLWRATQEWLADAGLDVPFWSVPWAGGQALARWVLDHPEEVRGRRVLDFGAGSGLVAIAAMRAGARSALAVDIDPLAEAAVAVNAEANGVVVTSLVADVVGSEVDADVLLAGDVWYERAPAERFGAWLGALASRGLRVVTGDPARAYVPSSLIELIRYEVPTSVDLESQERRTTRVLTWP